MRVHVHLHVRVRVHMRMRVCVRVLACSCISAQTFISSTVRIILTAILDSFPL